MTPQPDIGQHTLEAALFSFRYVRGLGEKAIRQLDDSQIVWTPGPHTNSIAVIVRHLHGNMLSRWTDFLSTDGEKQWRDRDGEFAPVNAMTRDEALRLYDEGWQRLFSAIEPLTAEQATAIVTIRGREHTVIEAVMRQVQHLSYHIGQIVLLARMQRGTAWQTLSIAPGTSKAYRPTGKY